MKGWVLFGYLGRQYLLSFVIFLLGLSGIIYLFEFAELMRRAADIPEMGLGLVLRMAAYKLPDTVDKILPFVVLFSGMFSFWRLTRSQELIVARAAGISAWQFLSPALLLTLLFGLLYVGMINPLGASLTSRYKDLENRYLKRIASLELTGAGLWLRQEEGGRHYLLHADKISMNPLTLTPLIAFVYDEKDTYIGRFDAEKAVLGVRSWDIRNVWFNWEGEDARFAETYTLETRLTLEQIQESMASPNTISFWELPSFIKALRGIGLPPVRHEIQLQSLLALPLLLCSMVFFAAAFSLRLSRRGGVLNAMMSGMFVGSVVFALNNMVASLGAGQNLPVLVAAWAIPLTALVGGQATLLYLEDG